jgi:diguanylate cyclase (GGDEF)-like protein
LLQTLSLASAAALRNVQLFEQVDKQRATVLAAVNMLPHPVMIVDQEERIIVSNRAADALLREIHASKNGKEAPDYLCSMPLLDLMNGLAESRWSTREITVGDKVYVATLEYASMVGTIILMQDVTDPVTGTFNRRHFHDLAEQAFQEAKRYAKPLAALMIGFEDVGPVTQQGSLAGNQILKDVVTKLRGLLRTPDILGRYQEDKFAVILPETTLENARVVAERILKLSKTSNFAGNDKLLPALTIGATILDVQMDNSLDALLEKAYRAYVTAQRDSGYQIKVYEEACDYQLSYL